MVLTNELKQELLQAQRMEATEKVLYERLAKRTKNEKNRETLLHIAEQEGKHYDFLKSITHEDIEPDHGKIRYYSFMTRFLGITFGLRLMEKDEHDAEALYGKVRSFAPEKVSRIIEEEKDHEHKALDMLESKTLDHVGSLVLGMNDALVELSGALAGLTFAFQDSRLIAWTGLLIGIPASLSMAASEYLSSKEEGKTKPFEASAFTGGAYTFTVIALVMPFFFPGSVFLHLIISLSLGITIIFLFNYYTSVMKNTSFKKSFFEMAGITVSVAAFSFVLGFIVRKYFGLEI